MFSKHPLTDATLLNGSARSSEDSSPEEECNEDFVFTLWDYYVPPEAYGMEERTENG